MFLVAPLVDGRGPTGRAPRPAGADEEAPWPLSPPSPIAQGNELPPGNAWATFQDGLTGTREAPTIGSKLAPYIGAARH
eukprot:3322710-Pyramimonas_sp.AAC.1